MPYVALDLETTGLDPETDEIIEVGMVRFDASGVMERYQSFVNPGRALEYRIAMLTGIAVGDLERAPHFGSIAAEVEAFIGFDPIVGQNPQFDVAFLARKGVQVFAPAYDTFELASILLGELREHSLGAIADHLGVAFTQRHRALADADAAREVFCALRERLAASPAPLLAEAERIASASDWPLRHLFREVAGERPRAAGAWDGEGMVHGFVRAPAASPEPLVVSPRPQPIDADACARLLSSEAARSALEGYEERPEQGAMARAVARSFAEGGHALVEAGTGVGKSLAYLVPAALHAAANGDRVVVSTNTINLQDQLITQDLPAARRILREAGIDEGALRVAQLKGRRNYLCLLRWAAARRSGSLSADEARVLVRLLFWLGRTETGDRAELNLRREEEAVWMRYSASDAGCIAAQCLYVRDGSCFLHRARKRAEAAHVLVVNHALLLSDVAAGGNVLPEYRRLVVDEAHHLEDEATQQFGFTASEADMLDWLDALQARAGRDRDAGFVASVTEAMRGERRDARITAALRALRDAAGRGRERVPAFFRQLHAFAQQHTAAPGEYDERLSINRSMRVQPDWADVESAWFDAEEALAEACGVLDDLRVLLADSEPDAVLDRDALIAEADEAYETGERLRTAVTRIIARDEPGAVCWLSASRFDASPSLSSAPLSVAETLRTQLFEPRETVVLTSATLAADGSFDYIKGRLGLESPDELLLGSPFDYERSTLILAPTDIPEPSQHGYTAAVQQAVLDLVRASQGRALVLFTSHAALRTAYAAIKRPLEEDEILVLGQGIDGAPRQLLSVLRANHRTVILGAASFWEGVDVTGEALSLLIMARLPFSVPSDPVFQARAELFDAPFDQYAVPQAILRFKQGFGRLIRRKTDRGVLAVLDRRLRSRRYGDAFLRSLPGCTLRETPARDMPAEVRRWLEPAAERASS
jgi:predicted DnaQ family exonuclease/DinG family helicase